ncbi:hypothetical protein AVEN_251446-1 [Araneus ventricosus]|uniref:Uncharacterized protein n=1 Tax=Araneus ventricosus TaxID=182803 RepID=A0A4Y2WZU8_ARAVE|nr:hypothetical protein AVEN_251446-1 [Araneus ventricosus]
MFGYCWRWLGKRLARSFHREGLSASTSKERGFEVHKIDGVVFEPFKFAGSLAVPSTIRNSCSAQEKSVVFLIIYINSNPISHSNTPSVMTRPISNKDDKNGNPTVVKEETDFIF